MNFLVDLPLANLATVNQDIEYTLECTVVYEQCTLVTNVHWKRTNVYINCSKATKNAPCVSYHLYAIFKKS